MANLPSRKLFNLPLWLWGVLVGIVIFRIPSLFEPYYYGDELIYLTLGEGIRKGLVLYKDIFDHKTPLLYYLAGLAGNVFWFRFILGVWMLATTVFYYKLISILFGNNKNIRFIAILVFVILTTIPLWEGQISNAELFMMGPVIIGLLLLSKLLRKNKEIPKIRSSYVFLSGIMFSVATLFKVPAMFEAGIVFFVALITFSTPKIEIKKFIKFAALWVFGFTIPIALSAVWFWLRGAGQEYLYGSLLINLGYISAFRPDDVAEPFLVKNGPLLFRGVLLLISVGALYFLKNKLSRTFIFLSAWLLFGLFAVTLSERPYPHYLIQLAPALSGLAALLFVGKTKEQVLTIFPLTIAFFVITYYNFWFYDTPSYYARFYAYISGKIDREEYFDRFNSEVNRNYKIADYIKSQTNSSDPIFVWGDFSNIYAISKRVPPTKYLTSFHINDFYSQEKVIEDLKAKIPKIIVVQPNSPDFQKLYEFMNNYSYKSVAQIDGAQIWQVQ